MRRRPTGLTELILIMLVLGSFCGMMIHSLFPGSAVFHFLVDSVFDTGASIFLASLRMLVVPVVFTSLVCGVASLEDSTHLGSLSLRSIGLYMLTTALAISLAIVFTLLFQPGFGFDLALKESYELRATPSLKETIINIFPSNPFRSLAEGNMLQVILFAVFIGFGLLKLSQKEKGKKSNLLRLFEEANSLIMILVMVLMKLAPYGVFMIMAKVFAVNGVTALKPLLGYFFCVLTVLLIHVSLTYLSLLKFFAKLSPFIFFKKMRSCLALAFSTASSSITLPLTMKSVINDLGVDRQIASFSLSLGATINMDGTAIMQGVATVFIAQAYQLDIGIVGYLTVVLMATLASIGTAGVPGVGLITLAMVLSQVGLPIEGIGLILGVDRLLDMFRTAVNVTGDAAISCVLARWDRKIDEKIFLST